MEILSVEVENTGELDEKVARIRWDNGPSAGTLMVVSRRIKERNDRKWVSDQTLHEAAPM